MKTCYKCKIEKDESEFYKDNSRHDALNPKCKLCVIEYQRTPEVKIKRQNYDQAPEVKERNRKREDTPERKMQSKESQIKRHEITEEFYNSIIKLQNGVCAICLLIPKLNKSGQPGFYIYHDHECCPGHYSCGKCVRGLLCHSCNTGIGFLKDSVQMLKSAISYLRRSNNYL